MSRDVRVYLYSFEGLTNSTNCICADNMAKTKAWKETFRRLSEQCLKIVIVFKEAFKNFKFIFIFEKESYKYNINLQTISGCKESTCTVYQLFIQLLIS